MNITYNKINNIKIKPLKVPQIDVTKIKGCKFFESLHPNVLLVARKNSGKTTVLYHILKNCANKLTKVIIFCSTVFKDPSYKLITEMFDKREIKYECFTEIVDGKINNIKKVIDEMNIGNDDKKEEKEDKKSKKLDRLKFLFCDSDSEEEEKVYVPKKIAPKYIFIYDDISEDLRSPEIAFLLKKNRHFGIMNIISTQSYKDITPSAWKQIDYSLLFKNIDDKAIEEIRNKLTLPTPENIFLKLYHDATDENYNFLYVDKNKVKYRKNFCIELNI